MNQERIAKFVAGKLSQAEAEAFEEYCLANPEFARQVEFEQRLKSGLVQVSRGSTAEFLRSGHNLGRWKIAAAASVLVALGTGYLAWRQIPHGANQLMAAVSTDAQRSGPSLRLALVRGAENAPQLASGIVRVEIVGLFDPGSHYSIALDRLEKKKNIDTVATLYGQHPSSPVTLEVMIDSDQLDSGAYSLRVRKQASDEEALDFGFVKF